MKKLKAVLIKDIHENFFALMTNLQLDQNGDSYEILLDLISDLSGLSEYLQHGEPTLSLVKEHRE